MTEKLIPIDKFTSISEGDIIHTPTINDRSIVTKIEERSNRPWVSLTTIPKYEGWRGEVWSVYLIELQTYLVKNTHGKYIQQYFLVKNE